LIVAADDAEIGYPPARVWGSPTTAMWVYRLGMERAKRLLLTGDSISGREAHTIGLVSKAVPLAELARETDALARRMAQLPVNQLAMMKLLLNQAYENMGLASTQLLGTLLDGVARHTPEGIAWRTEALERGVKAALATRDGPFGDYGSRPKR
jgi:enoyl-CoA hydratase